MCQKESENFCCVTALWVLGLFVTSLLTMIFSILNPKDYETFNNSYSSANYKKINIYDFLYDIDFKEEFQSYNSIKKWRNTEMIKYYNKTEINPYYQIKPQNEKCQFGTKKCGIINSNKDILCLNESTYKFKCPINEIIISSNNNPPDNSYNYKKYPMGDKFIFYTNEKTDNYIVKDLYINFDIDNKNFKNSEQIDKDKLSNLKIYNDISLKSDADIPSKAFLEVEHFTNNYTYQSMIGYTTIDEMNSDVKEYKNLLMGLGIACLSYVAVNIIIVIPVRNPDCMECKCTNKDCENDGYCGPLCYLWCQGCSCCMLFHRAKTFFCQFLPSTILTLISFIFTIEKMITYSKYSKKKYDDVEENDDLFKKSKKYNLGMFICLLINIIITVLYPFIVACISENKYNNLLRSKIYKTNNTKKYPRQNIQIQYAPVVYVPPYNIVNGPQNNWQYSPTDIQSLGPPYFYQ